MCTLEFFSHNVRSDIKSGGVFTVCSAAHDGRGCWSPGCGGSLNIAVGSRDPMGCSGVGEVSNPGVNLPLQRWKQNKGVNS